MKFEDLTPELQEKARACKTPEDILALAKEVGYELSEDELSSIAGGSGEYVEDEWDLVWDPRCSDYHCKYVTNR